MISRSILIGDKHVEGLEIPLQSTTLVLIVAPHGYLMCGYLNLAVAEKFGDCAAIIKGVKTIDDMLDAKVVEITDPARNRGISVGMTGRDALNKIV